MFIINILTYCKDLLIIRYLFVSCAFYGVFMLIRKVVFGK